MFTKGLGYQVPLIYQDVFVTRDGQHIRMGSMDEGNVTQCNWLGTSRLRTQGRSIGVSVLEDNMD